MLNLLQLGRSSDTSALHLARSRVSAAHILLLVLLIFSSHLSAQQSGSTPSAAKPASNPFSALLPEKPQAPIVSPEKPAAIPEQTGAIPLPDVAARSQDLSQYLRDAAAKLPRREQLEQVQADIDDIEPSLQTKLQEVNNLLAGSPNSLELREEENFWRGVDTTANGWQQQLLTWANSSQAALNTLNAQEPMWRATLEENQDNKELDPVLTVLQDNLIQIKSLRKQAQDVLQLAVNLQIKVGNLDGSANDAIARLGVARTQLKRHLLDRDSLPLWQLSGRREMGDSHAMSQSMHSRWISVVAFLKTKQGIIVFIFILLVASLAGARRLAILTRGLQPTDQIEVDAYRVMRHWIALGLLPPMMVGYVLAPSAPITLVGLLIMLSFFPILVILPPLVKPRFRSLLYVFAGIFAISWLTSWFGVRASSKREIEFFCSLALFSFLAFLVRPSRRFDDDISGWMKWMLFGIRCSVVGWAASLVASLFGYLKLAHYLAIACVYSTFVAISVFTVWRVLILLLTVGMRSPYAERLAVVRIHRNGINRWVPRALKILGAVLWLKGTSDLLGMTDSVNASVSRLLNFPIAGASGGATLGGVLGFFLIFAAGYAIAASIRFFFREELLCHFHLSRGLPELIASIIYYMLMLIVVLAAVNAAGIELNKFTVLTGAFGVGIGFGLQNIINNFVSGLILQFERPVHIDDIIEVDNNTGRVSRIGIRSSTIQTFQGAEVIIPNASLISSKVINWTLSESRRRRELPVGVAYGSDPKVVLKILCHAAAQHELVLSKPEPMAYFKGFGDSSLDFELHFWVMQENNGLLITSEVALAAMQAFDEAGIEIPFPQRDLRLRSIDPSAAVILQTTSDKSLSSADANAFGPTSHSVTSETKSAQ